MVVDCIMVASRYSELAQHYIRMCTYMRELASTRTLLLHYAGSRLRKEHSTETQEEFHVLPWPQRSFPLIDFDFNDIESVAASNCSSTRRWKVISMDEEHPSDQKSPLILKLSKS